ncbi:MAG TPA: hypothetical protein VFP74_11260 [Pseudolabrys sp.]|nr:hypothetical protein [Pseudolabrys sp.]
MNPVAAFFAKLVGAHLLFWRLSFKFFDAVPLFVAVLAMLGLTELSRTQEIKGAGQYMLVQFIISVFCYAFCYVWPKFRQQYQAVSMNMICLCLSVAFLAGLFALCSHFILSVDALRDTFGIALGKFIYGDLASLPFDVERTYMFILF